MRKTAIKICYHPKDAYKSVLDCYLKASEKIKFVSVVSRTV